MSTHAAVGQSMAVVSEEAGREATRKALSQLPGGRADIFFVYTTAQHEHEALLRGIREVGGDAKISGCSGEGIIFGNDSEETGHAVAVLGIQSTSMRFDTFLLRGYDQAPAKAGRELAQAVAEHPDAKVLIVMPDGLVGDCTTFLDELGTNLPKHVRVVGGTSGDAFEFERTYQYEGTVATSGAVSAVLISGNVRAEVAVSHGCRSVGIQRTITSAEGCWVHTIDNRPAWEVFKEYLDGDPQDLNAEGILHLCVGVPLEEQHASEYDRYIIRTPMDLDKERGSLFFPGGGLEDGQVIHLTRRDLEKIRDSAQATAQRILEAGHNKSPDLVMQFDCAGRGRVLFGACAAEELVEPLRNTLGSSVPWVGFHTYGEIAQISGKPFYHNYTVALCALYES